MSKGEEREFRLRPRKPPIPRQKGNGLRLAAAFKTIACFAGASRQCRLHAAPRRHRGKSPTTVCNQRWVVRVTYVRNSDDDQASAWSVDTFTLTLTTGLALFVPSRGPKLEGILSEFFQPVETIEERAHAPFARSLHSKSPSPADLSKRTLFVCRTWRVSANVHSSLVGRVQVKREIAFVFIGFITCPGWAQAGLAYRGLSLTADNNDLLHQFVLPGVDAAVNHVEIRFDGKGGLAYQVVGRYFMPWNERPEKEPLSIDVSYDRTRLAQDDIATATANIRHNLAKPANMVMIDLGIPPGFDLLSERPADLPGEERTSEERALGEIQPHGHAGHSVLRFACARRGNHATVSLAGQVSDPCADAALASLRILRPRSELCCASSEVGSAETIRPAGSASRRGWRVGRFGATRVNGYDSGHQARPNLHDHYVGSRTESTSDRGRRVV
jgi:hypothetical protein